MILDDNKQVCKGPKTGLWVQNKFHAAKDDGTIYIEYQKSAQDLKVIMQHNEFSQLGDFTCKTESYEFQAGFFLNQESVIMGSTATVLVTPHLQINGRSADLKLLQNIKATIRTEDFINGIPTTLNFDNIKAQANKEIMLSF